jgi:DNA (cytosine-5)-methyltransferase 1
MGYHRAGFDVIGVDCEPQPNYPFKSFRGDALSWLGTIAGGRTNPFLGRIDVIHASPPCQFYSVASKNWNGNRNAHPDHIAMVREFLKASEKPYIIENVCGAPLINPIMLCGTMFDGLRVIRHRLFESNMPLKAPDTHPEHPLCYTRDKRKNHYGKCDEMEDFVMVNGGGNCSKEAAADAMGIDWMTKVELNEAIPPAYTEFLGRQAIAFLQGR